MDDSFLERPCVAWLTKFYQSAAGYVAVAVVESSEFWIDSGLWQSRFFWQG
jgi:hypothetical protein